MVQSERLPAGAVAAGILLAVPIVTLAIALALTLVSGGASFPGLPRVWFNAMVAGFPMALGIGLPIALSRLRDRALGDLSWAMAGAFAGALGGALVMFGLAVATRLLELIGHFVVGAALVLGISAAGGVLAALLARRIALCIARR
jgi:hypothetical protein